MKLCRHARQRVRGREGKRGASRTRAFSSIVKQPGFALRATPGTARASHTDTRHRPVFSPAPGLAGRSALGACPFAQNQCSLLRRRGVRNDRAFHRARGARTCLHAGSPHAAFAAHGQWPSPTPKIVEPNRASEADLRLRSAREWTLRLAASLTGNCRLRRPRPDRTSCRAGMHLDRPPVASASLSCPTADPRLSSVIRSIQARHRSGHRIPLRVSMTIATRPSPERDGSDDISPTAAVKNKVTNIDQLFFLKTRKRMRPQASRLDSLPGGAGLAWCVSARSTARFSSCALGC